MRILMLSSTVPYPPGYGGTEVRTFYLAQGLSRDHAVTLVTQPTPLTLTGDLAMLRQLVTTLALFPRLEDAGWDGWLSRYGVALRQGAPLNVVYRYGRSLHDWVNAQVMRRQFDIVTCEHGVNAIYVPPQPRGPHDWPIPTVLNAHSFATNTLREPPSSGETWRDRLRRPLARSLATRYERRFAQQFSRLVVTTAEDAAQAQALCPAVPVSVVANGVDLTQFPRRTVDPGGHDLVFVGAMDADHNQEAMRWFVATVWPLLRRRYEDITLTIVGDRPTASMVALAQQPGIRVTGRVAAVVDWFQAATVCVLPLRTGFGIKNKTLEALAAGVPVVGSDRALEGLPVDGDHPCCALRANTPDEFLEAIARLLDDADLRHTLAKRGRSLIVQHYTWGQMVRAYSEALHHTIAEFSPTDQTPRR